MKILRLRETKQEEGVHYAHLNTTHDASSVLRANYFLLKIRLGKLYKKNDSSKMAAIRKSSVKSKSRGCINIKAVFCNVMILLSFGSLWKVLYLDQDFFLEHEKYGPLTAISVEGQSSSNRVGSNKVKLLPSPPLEKKEPEIPLSFPKSNADHFRNPSVSLEKPVYMYHHTLKSSNGKEGALVLDMLLAHAHAYHQGGIYGGSCGEGNDVGRVPENALIRAIGLQDYLQFACPRDLETNDRKKTLPGKSYVQDGTRAFIPEYVDLLKGVIKYPKKQETKKKTNVIVVHIARGKKFTPCRKANYQGFDPYLPNRHYKVRRNLEWWPGKRHCEVLFSNCIIDTNFYLLSYSFGNQLLIKKYSKPGYDNKVIIYSQSTSYEKLDMFRDQGYELHIDEDIADVWKAVMKADVFIMSRSSFSFVPALVANDSTKVVYTPFWHKPIKGWDIVGNDILSQSDAEFKRMKGTCKGDHVMERFLKKKKG